MNRWAYALVVGVVGAALVHVAVMLALPGHLSGQAWGRLAGALPALTARGAETLPVATGDPFFRTVLCRGDLRDGPMQLSATGRSAFWTAAVVSPDGRAVAGVDAAKTDGNAPDLVVLTAEQLEVSRAGQAFPLVTEPGEALLVLRVAVPDESWTRPTEEMLRTVSCRVEPLGR